LVGGTCFGLKIRHAGEGLVHELTAPTLFFKPRPLSSYGQVAHKYVVRGVINHDAQYVTPLWGLAGSSERSCEVEARTEVHNCDDTDPIRREFVHFIFGVDQGGDGHQSVLHQFPVVIKRPHVLSMNESSLHRLHDVCACFADESARNMCFSVFFEMPMCIAAHVRHVRVSSVFSIGH